MSVLEVLEQPKYRIAEVERNWNFKVECNNCKKTAYFNAGVYNAKTGKRILLEEEYYPNTGMVPKVHWGCMLNGVKNYVKDGKVVKPDNFWKDLVIQEKDNTVVKGIKMARQDKLTKRRQDNNKKFYFPINKDWWSHSFEY